MALRGTAIRAMWLLAVGIGCDGGDGAPADARDPTPGAIEKTVQWGSDDEDGVRGAAGDSDGNVYLTGYAMGALPGNSYAGSVDVFLTKVDDSGDVVWTRQYGTTAWDQPFAVATSADGDVYVTGGTFGDLAGHVQIGAGDVFLSRFAPDGTEIWTQVWGGAEEDIGYGVTVDSNGAVYVVGWTSGDLGGTGNGGNTDNFLTKLDSAGNISWTRQWGGEGFEDPAAIAVDSEDQVYITGKTGGSLDGNPLVGVRDVFLTRFSGDGTKAWTRQWGHGDVDCGRSIAISADDALYIAGYVIPPESANLAADVFLTRLDRDGQIEWTDIWGTYEIENGWSVAIDGAGDVLVTGKTLADLEGNTNAGGMCGEFPCADVYLTKTTPEGERLSTRQWGTIREDFGSAVVVGETGVVFVAGATTGDLGGPNAGSYDAFVTLFRPVGYD